LRYSIDWQDGAENVAPEERATVGDLRLWIGEQNVTMYLDGYRTDDHVTLALYAMAHGLAHDWWTIFGGRDREVSLIRHRSGFALPDIRMRFDGADFEITAANCLYRNPSVRFWTGPTEVAPRVDAEVFLERFIEEILERLHDRDIEGTSAQLRWRRVQESRESDEAEFCEAVGALGLDPYSIDDVTASAIGEAEALFRGEALTEFISGAENVERHPLLEWVRTSDRRPAFEARIAELRAVSDQVTENAPAREHEPAWSLGYRRASAMRRAMNLASEYRFRSFREVAEPLGASRSYRLAGRVDGIRALRSDHDNGVRIHLRSHGESPQAKTAHLFTFARAVGDVVCFPEPDRAPINDLHSAHRQAAGRAFAAEFLAPIDEVESMLDDKRDILSIADEFSVSTVVIERQIENSDRIRQACG